MMGYLLLAAGALWLATGRIGLPPVLRWSLLVLYYCGVMLLLVLAPKGSDIASPKAWAVLGGVLLAVLAYRKVLEMLRSKVASKGDPIARDTPKSTFSETELNRYARHIIMREIGGAGQKKLKNARVLVIGAGGLGSPVLLYLAAAGVGVIGVVDDDEVDNSNLQRQVIHNDQDIGMPKVFSAEVSMRAQNPFVEVKPYHRRLTEDIATELFTQYDLVLDGTDNFETRYMVNRVCVATGTPLIAGALTQWEGQISTYDPAKGAPCYQCVFPKAPADGLAPSCAEAGVVGPLPGVIGAMMAVEVIKEITGAGEGLRGEMLIYDALYAETRKIKMKPRVDCPVCSDKK